MREVYEVKPANLAKAQELLGKDDIVSRQSIYTRNASALGLQNGKVYIIIDGSGEAVKKADELLKDLAAKSAEKENILKRFDEIEKASASGFGFLGI